VLARRRRREVPRRWSGRSGPPELSADVAGVRLGAPVLVAPGVGGLGDELGAFGDLGRLGAIVTKSVSVRPWPGNRPPRLVPLEVDVVNAVGLQGPGLAAWIADDLPRALRAGARVVASVWGSSVADFGEAGRMLADAPVGLVAVEANVSCPNLADGERMFSLSERATAQAVGALQAAVDLPVWAKLSLAAPEPWVIGRAALDAGASALVLGNTLPASVIDVERGAVALGAGSGGLSGPSLRPVAARALLECRDRLGDCGLVGVGGVGRGVHAVELAMAGADAVEVGTATLADPRQPWRVLDEVSEWLVAHGFGRWRDVVGLALPSWREARRGGRT